MNRNMGIAITSLGIIMVLSRIRNTTFRPQKGMRAKEYPASEAKMMVPAVTSTAMYTLFQ
ncbi:hypothetical protein D3C76_1882720 [compost metagenome]